MRNRPRDFRMRTLVLLFIWLASAVSGWGASAATRDLSEFFGGREGCFVLYDAHEDAYLRYNPQGCAQRFSPCSTFKIASTLIALDTGVVSGPEFSLKWDGVKRPIAPWNQDHTLRSAIQHSVVWFFQDVARRIGPERMAECVRKFDYGNGDISGGTTNFWLNSSLRLSADEQVRFLRRLWADQLSVSEEAQRLTRELLELSRSENGRVLYGKDRHGRRPPGRPRHAGLVCGLCEPGGAPVLLCHPDHGNQGRQRQAGPPDHRGHFDQVTDLRKCRARQLGSAQAAGDHRFGCGPRS